jgi:serine protease
MNRPLSASHGAFTVFLMIFGVLAVLLPLSACKKAPEPPPATVSTPPPPPRVSPMKPPATPPVEPTPEVIAQNQAAVEEEAREQRSAATAKTYEEWKATVFKEPFEGGSFIVNGDTKIPDEKHLREFYDEMRTLNQPGSDTLTPPHEVALTVATVGGLDAVWNAVDKLRLTYCVSDAFGARKAAVVADMTAAAGAWEESALVDLVHVPAQDAACTASNANVTFDVRPVDVDGEYLARAFFPNEPRADRNVLIDDTSFDLDPPPSKLQLVGILRHELGHALGFRHEHTRPEAGRCFEDNDFRPQTAYDAFSVMHYPQCNGGGDWSLTLTAKDKNGIACLYGARTGFTIDTAICQARAQNAVPAGAAATVEFLAQSVALDAQKQYGPFRVAPGSVFEARIGGASSSGDPDLYVRYRREPTRNRYNCRPFLSGAVEKCSIDVPATETQAFVMVRGFAAGTFDLTVVHVPPAP